MFSIQDIPLTHRVKFENTPTITVKFPHVVTVKFENTLIWVIPLTHAVDMLSICNLHILCGYVTHVLDLGYPPYTCCFAHAADI